jgi:hypothetical protein
VRQSPTTPCRTPDSPVLYVEIQFIAHAIPSARDAMRRAVLTADQQINRRVKIIGLALVVISSSHRPQVDDSHALVKAGRLTHAAGEARA